MDEEWKSIPGYEGLYEASTLGRIRRLKKNADGSIEWIIRHISFDKRGRATISLSKDGKAKSMSYPRAIAFTFVPNPDQSIYTEVNHKDENPLNNKPSNLEWCTHKYNCNYGTRVQRIKDKQNVPVLQYSIDGKFIAEHASMHVAAESIDAEAGHICDCCLGNRSIAYGFFWRYKDEKLYNIAKIKLEEKIKASKESRTDKFLNRSLNVVQLDLNGNYICTYQSSKLAAQAVGSYRPMIINCCNGKIATVKGYKFMYERDYKKSKNRNNYPYSDDEEERRQVEAPRAVS